MSEKVFYISYFSDRKVQTSLDSMKLLCNPFTSLRAHITLRGPYKRKFSMPRLTERSKNLEIKITGVNAFLGQKQNTVFLECQKDLFIETFWKKDDYSDIVPHITIYNGESRYFAENLLERLSRTSINFTTELKGITEYVSKVQKKSLISGNPFLINDLFSNQIIDLPFSFDDIIHFTDEEKIRNVELIAEKLSVLSCYRTLF